jgi:hypothetical protein
MKYWGVFVGKLIAAALVLYAIWAVLYRFYPFPAYFALHPQEAFLHDLPWTSVMFLYNLLVQGVLFLVIMDQRYRCRTCGRRLRMPVNQGSHAHVLFGPPRTDYICVYGHGTLKVPQLHLSGRDRPDWKENDDMWTELASTSGKNPDDA